MHVGRLFTARQLTLLAPLLMSASLHAAEICTPPQLTAQAEGFVEAVPDRVILDVSISHTAPTLAEAKKRVDQIGSGVIRAAEQLRIGKDDVAASKIQAAPDYDWNNGKRELRGQQVSRQFELKLRDVERYGALVQALADADVTQINGIRTEFSQQEQLEQQALQQAIANVQAKANTMAGGFGRKVVSVIAVNEDGAGVQPQAYELRAAKAVSAAAGDEAALVVGKRRIGKSVSATFRLDGDCISR